MARRLLKISYIGLSPREMSVHMTSFSATEAYFFKLETEKKRSNVIDAHIGLSLVNRYVYCNTIFSNSH